MNDLAIKLIVFGIICGIISFFSWRSHVKFDKAIGDRPASTWTKDEKLQHDARFLPQIICFALSAIFLLGGLLTAVIVVAISVPPQ